MLLIILFTKDDERHRRRDHGLPLVIIKSPLCWEPCCCCRKGVSKVKLKTGLPGLCPLFLNWPCHMSL